MSGYFSKESRQKRVEKNFKMGRIRFSAIGSLFFAIGVTFFAILLDVILNNIFGDPNRLEAILSYRTLYKFVFMFVIWYLFAYYYLWVELVRDHDKILKDDE